MPIVNERITKILKRYYTLQIENGNVLTPSQKEEMVNELQRAYNSMDISEKRNLLLPAKAQFLADPTLKRDEVSSGKFLYDIDYNWPPNDGFAGVPTKDSLHYGEEFDRIGSPFGRYLAPMCVGQTPATYLMRALPYYIPEKDITDSPSYHRYKAIAKYEGDNSDDKKVVWRGVVAQAFWKNPDDGGGDQVKLPKRINLLGGVLNEITKSPT